MLVTWKDCLMGDRKISQVEGIGQQWRRVKGSNRDYIYLVRRYDGPTYEPQPYGGKQEEEQYNSIMPF